MNHNAHDIKWQCICTPPFHIPILSLSSALPSTESHYTTQPTKTHSLHHTACLGLLEDNAGVQATHLAALMDLCHATAAVAGRLMTTHQTVLAMAA
jgi:hypothetical protein